MENDKLKTLLHNQVFYLILLKKSKRRLSVAANR